METCTVCCENYDKKDKQKIFCDFCDYHQCLQCLKTYLLSIKNKQCMSCNVQWNHSYLRQILPNDLLKDIIQQKKNILFENEKLLFPQYTEMIKDEKEQLDRKHAHELLIVQLNIKRLQIKEKNIQKKITCPKCQQYIQKKEVCEQCIEKKFDQCVRKGCNKCFQCQVQLCIKCHDIIHQIEPHQCLQDTQQIMEQIINENDTYHELQYENNNQKQALDYYVGCPQQDCEGIITIRKNQNTDFSCGICQSEICKRCNCLVSDQEHSCKDEDIQAIYKIKKQSKQCPKCHTNISKISGCNDMFCTICHTSFDWATGLEHEGAHNPHQVEFLRNHDLPQNQQFCFNNTLNINLITQKLRPIITQQQLEYIQNYIGNINHTYQTDITRMQTYTTQEFQNYDIGKKYLNKHFEKTKYLDLLQMRDKKKQKYIQFIQVLQTYVNIGQEQIRDIYDNLGINIKKNIQILENLTDYTLSNLQTTRNQFKSKKTFPRIENQS